MKRLLFTLTLSFLSAPSFATYFPPTECVDMAFNTNDVDQNLQTIPNRETNSCQLKYTITEKSSGRKLQERTVEFVVVGNTKRLGEKVFWGALTPVLYGVDSAVIFAEFAGSILTFQNPKQKYSSQWKEGLGSAAVEGYRNAAAYCNPADSSPESPSRKFLQDTRRDQSTLRYYARACLTEEGLIRGLGDQLLGY